MKTLFAAAATALVLGSGAFFAPSSAEAAPIAAKALVETAASPVDQARYYHRHHMRHHRYMMHHGRGHHYGWRRGRHNPHHG